MNWAVIDIVFVVLILVASIRGAFVGMIGEILSIAALFLSLLLAAVFYPDGASWIQSRSSIEGSAYIIAYTMIFLFSFIILKLLQKGIGLLIKEGPFEGADKLLGFFFGILEGILFSFLIVYLLNFQPFFDIDKLVKGSEIVPYMERFLPALDTTSRKVFEHLQI